jgi:hypothetical protein
MHAEEREVEFKLMMSVEPSCDKHRKAIISSL